MSTEKIGDIEALPTVRATAEVLTTLVLGDSMPLNEGTLNFVPVTIMTDSKSLTSQKEEVTDRLVLATRSETRSPNVH